jgi:hypothetical protein
MFLLTGKALVHKELKLAVKFVKKKLLRHMQISYRLMALLCFAHILTAVLSVPFARKLVFLSE